jgi:hypothetical protein
MIPRIDEVDQGPVRLRSYRSTVVRFVRNREHWHRRRLWIDEVGLSAFAETVAEEVQ